MVLGCCYLASPDGLADARFEKRIYIALPDVTARRVMFKLNLGDTRNTLQDHDFAELAEMTDGYDRSS